MRGQGLFSISSIQLFVYLIAPLADMVSEEDIASNIRLESGLKIWQALWQYRQPDVWCFTAPVKPRRDELPQVMFLRRPTATSIPQSQGIYLGEEEKPRRLSIVPPPKPPRTDRAVLDEKRRRELEKQREKERKAECTGNGSAATLLEQPSTSQPLTDVHDQLPSPSTSAPCIVRSVSEYKTGESMNQARDRIAKSNTTNAFDMSPTSESSLQMLDEVDTALKITTHLSGVFCPSDAPLVNLHDICSGYSLETSENGYESTSVEVICDLCHKSRFFVIGYDRVAANAKKPALSGSGPSTSFRTADVTGSTDDDLEDSCQPDPM
ncbi:hypothetical protein OSTOST_17740, partial [Ostertagia ostertagi]